MNKSPQILAEQYTIATETSNFIYGGKSNTFFHIFSGKITQNQLYACDSKSECKKLIKTFGTKPPTREHHTCVLYNNEIFVFGGYSENNQCTDIYALDLRTKKWRSLKSTFFKTSLYHHTSIVYEGSMFVFGGISGNSVSNSLYKYTFSTNQWEVVVTNQNDVFLPSSRFKHSSFIHDECLYILGGRNFKIQIFDTVKEDNYEVLFIGTNEFLFMQILKYTKEEEVEVLQIEKENLKNFYYIFPVKKFFSFNKKNQKLLQTIQIDPLRQRVFVLFDGKLFVFQYKNEENEYKLFLKGTLDCVKGMKFFAMNKSPHLHHKMIAIIQNEVPLKKMFENKKKLIEFQLIIDENGNCSIRNEVIIKNVHFVDSITSIEFIDDFLCLSSKSNYWIYNKKINEIINHSNQTITNKELKEKISQKIGYEKNHGLYSILYKFMGNDTNFHFEKKPIWKSEPSQLFHFYPFVIALLKDRIQFYHVLMKEIMVSSEIKFQSPLCIQSNGRRIFVSNATSVISISPVSFYSQQLNLIWNENILWELAMDLFQHQCKFNLIHDSKIHLNNLKKQNGFSNLTKGNWKIAFQNFSECTSIDILESFEIINLFIDSEDYFHEQFEFLENESKSVQYSKKLIQLISEKGKISSIDYFCKMNGKNSKEREIDEINQYFTKELIEFKLENLLTGKNFINEKELVQLYHYLQNENLLKYLAYLLWNKGCYKQFVTLKNPLDLLYKASEFLILENFLCEVDLDETIFKYAQKIIKKGKFTFNSLRIFVSENRNEIVESQKVFEFLKQNLDTFDYPIYELEYLYLLTKKNNDYAMSFISNAIKLLYHVYPNILQQFNFFSSQNEIGYCGEIRKKLSEILSIAELSKYQKEQILNSLKVTCLFDEGITIYKSLLHHEEVLVLYIHFLKDYESAEKYCLQISEIDECYQTSFIQLLNACFISQEKKCEIWSIRTKSDKKKVHEFVFKILNKYPFEINPEEILKILPNDFSLEKLENFIQKSFFKKIYLKNTSILYLKFIENELTKEDCLSSSCSPRVVYSDSFCHSCHQRIDKGIPIYFNYPNFDVHHAKCPTKKIK
eukprot:gene10110-2530_t